MIKFTQYLEQLPENFFASLDRQKLATGARIFDFSKGNPDLPPPFSIRQQASNWLLRPECHGYASTRGEADLRQQLAQVYRQHLQITIDPEEEILITAGAKEALWLLALALVGPSTVTAINDVSYPLYRKMVELLGGKVEYFSLAATGNSHLAVQHLPRQMQVAFLTDPHMPLGRKFAPESLQLFCQELTAKSGALILDSPYGMLFSGRPRSIFHLDPEKKCSFEVSSCSKIFQIAGWRIGWIVAGKEQIRKLLKIKGYLDNGILTPLQMGAAAALALANSDPGYFSSLQAIYQERRGEMEQLFSLLGLDGEHGQEGMFCWGKMRINHPYGQDDRKLCQEILAQTQVILTPGSIYGPGGVGYVRACLTVPRNEIIDARTSILSAGLGLSGER